MIESYNRKCLALAIAVSLSACGGGGGGGGGGTSVASASPPGGGGGIGGTGVTSSGTIDGFGSIFVNGIEFETDDAEIFVDGERAGEDALRLGMVVQVNGSVNDDGVTGSADRVVFDDEVQGPVETLEFSQDGDSLLLHVLGTAVIVERTGTVFEDVRFDAIAIGDVLEVSGFQDGDGRLRATRIEKKDDFVAGISEVERKGVIAGLMGTQFRLGDLTVDFSGADLSGVPGGTLADGMQVEVRGTLENGRITATSIDEEDDPGRSFGDDDDVSVQGTVSGFVDSGSFMVNGIAVDAGGAVLRPSTLVLGNGAVVEVEGTWDGRVLRARRVEARRGRVEIEATVTAIDTQQRTLTLQLAGGTVTVRLDNRTQLDDDTGIADTLRLSDIGMGDFVEVEAILADGDLVATRVDRDDADDDVVQAPVDGFVSGSSITVLGITYSTDGARFEDQDDGSLTQEQFYSNLQAGALVKVKDRNGDGIAEEVEFEFEGGLDGDREFASGDDDDDDDDSGSDGCDDDSGSDDCDSDDSDSDESDSDDSDSDDSDSDDSDSDDSDSDDSDSDDSESDDSGSDDSGSDDSGSDDSGSDDSGSDDSGSDDSGSDDSGSDDSTGDSSSDDGLDDSPDDASDDNSAPGS